MFRVEKKMVTSLMDMTAPKQQDTALSVRVCHTGLGLVTLDPNKGVVAHGDQTGGTHGGHIREVKKGVLGIKIRAAKKVLYLRLLMLYDLFLLCSTYFKR